MDFETKTFKIAPVGMERGIQPNVNWCGGSERFGTSISIMPRYEIVVDSQMWEQFLEYFLKRNFGILEFFVLSQKQGQFSNYNYSRWGTIFVNLLLGSSQIRHFEQQKYQLQLTKTIQVTYLHSFFVDLNMSVNPKVNIVVVEAYLGCRQRMDFALNRIAQTT